MNSKSFLIGLIVGGAAASISALLTAPHSGRETRENVKANAECIKNQMAELKNQLIALSNSAVSATKEGKEAITALSSDIKTVITEWRHDILPHQQNLQNEIKRIEEAIDNLEKVLK
ncbi:YtxH domain-containing protein [Cytobacillus depressus]|uniref:YtxH domain-containing protein n=1 Tax=Cytobacillus depressus TaxID=1602942 RepID=A0A6L3V6R1_9BACI|nr:YtxH domain-containing protein [Cytobacillus depressus]KAB2337132.1 YtxH domain-containing protein [Cytobacillus depressus]